MQQVAMVMTKSDTRAMLSMATIFLRLKLPAERLEHVGSASFGGTVRDGHAPSIDEVIRVPRETLSLTSG